MMASRLLACGALLGVCGFAAEDGGGKLTVFMGGKPVATETYSVLKSDGKVELSGTGKAELGPIKISIDRFTVVTDEAFKPVSVQAKAQMGQMKLEDAVTFEGGKAKNQLDTGQGPQAKEDDVHADALIVNSNLPLFAWTLMAMRAKLEGPEPQQFNAYIIGQVEVPVSVVFKGKETVEFADRKAELNHLAVSFPPSASAAPILVDFWVNDARKIVKVAVPAQSVEAYQDGFERKAPAPAAAPAPAPADPVKK